MKKQTVQMFGVVFEKGNRKATLIIERSNYSSKKAFASDLRSNGYAVKFIFNQADYAKVLAAVETKGSHMLNEQEDIIREHMKGVE